MHVVDETYCFTSKARFLIQSITYYESDVYIHTTYYFDTTEVSK